MKNIFIWDLVARCNVISGKGVCEHLVEVAIITKLSLPGLVHEKTLTVRTRHRSKKVNRSQIISESYSKCNKGKHIDLDSNNSNSDKILENVETDNY